MTTSRQSQAAMRLVRRHPRAAGLVLIALGVWMGAQCFRDGERLAPFVGGAPVEGRVIQIANVGTTTPEYRMEVAWLGMDGAERTGATRVYKQDFERLGAGDPVALLIARDDPGAVVSRGIFERAGIIRVGSEAATPLVWFAALMVLGGALLLATGPRFLRPAA